MSDNRPIGILDSGIGGLSIVREITRQMPGERIVYLGDTLHYPYGNRSDQSICMHTMQCVNTIMKHDIKLLVAGCNTMAAIALDTIEKKIHDIPVIGGLLPGVRAAVLRTADKKIGVIGTHATIRSGTYKEAIHQIDSSVDVYEVATPLLSPIAEEMMFDHDITRMTTQFYLYEMIDIGVDCLILGNTTYPCLFEVIQGTVGTRMQLLDTALWTAKEVQDILSALDLCTDHAENGYDESIFYLTEAIEYGKKLIPVLLGTTSPQFQTISLEKEL